MPRSRASVAPTFSPPSPWFLAIIVVAALLLWFFGRSTLADLHERAGDFNAAAVIAALLILPLVGVPVSVLHAVTGARFGLPMGMALVALSIAFQLVASYLIVLAAPKFFAKRFAWLRGRLPTSAHRSLTLFTMLLPGAPYFAQNYVLAGAGVPFGIYFGYSFFIHVVRSVVGVIFGEWSGDLTPMRAAVFVTYAIVVTLACGLAFRRLRDQWRNPPKAAGGRKRRVSAASAAR